MLSKGQEQGIERKKRLLEQLKADFKHILNIPFKKLDPREPALVDFLKQLDLWHNEDKSKAVAEIDNPAKAMALLQSANAYSRVKEYIQRQLSE